jgi:hypothetical protein
LKKLLFSLLIIIISLSNTNGQYVLIPVPRIDTTGKTMVQMLRELADSTKPSEAFFMNTKRAEILDKEWMQTADLQQQIKIKIELAYQLLQAGQTKQSVKLLAHLMQMADSMKMPIQKDMYDMLAVAYLRHGEQENCCAKHTGESCIIPISAAGQHTKPDGSNKAIYVFSKILEADPNDLQAIWLLNIAYMTLGKYPHEVPKQFLLEIKDEEILTQKFKDIAPNLGIDVLGLSGGICLEDFNNDGFLDIMCSSYGLNDQLQFFLNNTKGGFVNKTSTSGLQGQFGGLNLIHADYDNDGFEDVLVLRGGWWDKVGEIPNSLLKNNGNGTFTDVTIKAGLLSLNPTQVGAWADFNLDGHLDLFIGNETKFGKRDHPCEMYVNNGNGTFTNVAKKLGFGFSEFVKGAVWGDVNNDGLPDLYVSIMGDKNKLFLNKGGKNINDWQFEDIASKAGVTEPINSFPCAMFDFNHDGLQDIFVSGYSVDRLTKVSEDMANELRGNKPIAATPKLYINKGNNTFTDYSKEAGFEKKVCYTMGMNYGDLDNDGWLDLYLGTGAPDYSTIVPNRMFKNATGKKFNEVTYSGGFGQLQKGHGIAFGDTDNDGDQDIYVVLGGAIEGDTYNNELFENPGNANAWIKLKLQGSKGCNASAIGTKIKITIIDKAGNERVIHNVVSTGGSFGSSSLAQEIGLGDAKTIKEIEIIWADKARTKSVFIGVEMNKNYVVKGDKIY